MTTIRIRRLIIFGRLIFLWQNGTKERKNNGICKIRINRDAQSSALTRICGEDPISCEAISGLGAEPVSERVKEIAGDEQKHEEIFRNLICAYLGGKPLIKLAEVFEGKDTKQILEVNLKGEKKAVYFMIEIKSFGSFSRIVMSCDTLAWVMPKRLPAAVCVL